VTVVNPVNPVAQVKQVKPFEAEDRDRLILAPYISRFYSPAISGPLLQMGYRIETLAAPDRESVEIGLKYCNNEVCYPAVVYIGDLIKALQSGRYDLDRVAAGSWQTGGQCRASCILGALKRAMIAAGFERVPVVALTTGGANQDQPGFDLDRRKYIQRALLAIAYADSVAEMYYATASRERDCVRGAALALADRHMEPLADGSLTLERQTVLDAIRSAALDFNEVETDEGPLPTVGIVGEIFVKYNSFSNHDVARWLMAQGLEVVVPPVAEFFSSWLLGPGLQVRHDLKRPSPRWAIAAVLRRYSEDVLADVAQVMKTFRHARPRHCIEDIAAHAEGVVSLAHQYGESWLIAGEIGALVSEGVRNLLCLQPFGCIANQVVARGIERRLKTTHKDLNLLMLDSDAGTSEVNYFNRLHFFVSHARRYS
jgi:predicted nucleotide-binding protein (sugar kinase/HSP70/actin superfamily)